MEEPAHPPGGGEGFDGQEVPDRPPRGDVVEIPGDPIAVEYEEVRSAPPWLTPLAISVVALFAVFVVARAAVVNQVDPIELSQQPSGSVPTALVDGSPLPDLPEAISERFAAPVVGTVMAVNVPEGLTERCAQPFSAEQLDPVAFERINDVIARGQITDVRLGPEVLSVLRTGTADSPPAWPDTWALSCLGRLEGEAWVARPPRLSFAREGERGAADGEPGVVALLTEVPAEGTWAVHERDGWWSAAPVQPGSWVQLVVPVERVRASLRVVFLDDDGEVIADNELAPARGDLLDPGEGEGADGPRTAGATLDAGSVDEILSAALEAPVRRCDDVLGACVWITRVGSELQAYAAHGPHHLDVPPFGELGWCPDARRFQGTVTRSQFLPEGTWRAGIAPRSVDAYSLRFSGGRVVVDLGNVLPGDPAVGESRASTFCTFSGEPTGEPAENPDAIAPLG